MTPAPVTARARVCFYITPLYPALCFAGFSAQLGRPPLSFSGSCRIPATGAAQTVLRTVPADFVRCGGSAAGAAPALSPFTHSPSHCIPAAAPL